MPDDIELNIDKTVDDFIGEVAPGSEPSPAVETAEPALAPAVTSLAKPAPKGGAAPLDPIAYPKSWKQDHAGLWDKVPRQLQEYVTGTREKDYLEGLEQYKAGHTQYAQFAEVLQPYMPRINSLGMQPVEAIRALMNADWALSQGTHEQKVTMLRQICQNYQIDPRLLIGAGGQSDDPNAVQPTPAELAIRKELGEVRHTVSGFMNAQVAAQRSVIDREVATFFADPAHVHLNEVGDHIVRLINADKNISLKDAYDQAVWANPATRAKEMERLNKERSETDRKAREEAARRANAARAANVRGQPSARTTTAPKGGWEDELPVTAAKLKVN